VPESPLLQFSCFGIVFCKTVDDRRACVVEDVIAKPLIRSFERNVLLLLRGDFKDDAKACPA
jgi:hypothetical protein